MERNFITISVPVDIFKIATLLQALNTFSVIEIALSFPQQVYNCSIRKLCYTNCSILFYRHFLPFNKMSMKQKHRDHAIDCTYSIHFVTE